MKRIFSFALLIILLGSILGGCISEDDKNTIAETAKENGNFTTLVQLLELTGLYETLEGEGPYTVFAPTDDAFDAVPEELLNQLLADTEILKQVLLYHVVSGSVDSTAVTSYDSVDSVQGEAISITTNGTVMVNDSTVTTADIECSNGYIHVIDAVMLPPSLQPPGTIVETAIENGNFTTLVTAVQAAGLVDTLNGEGPFTVFAPTDDAFEALPDGLIESLLDDIPTLTKVLTYHVLNGALYSGDVVARENLLSLQGENIEVTVNGTVKVNDATVILTDIECSNGVIHVIDSVILPPSISMPTIYEQLTKDSRLSTLATAVALADLDDALNGDGPFTLFAPTNAAFEALPEGELENIIADKDMLTNILLHHVLPSVYYESNVMSYDILPTAPLYGDYLSFDDFGGFAFVQTDIECSNGVIHLINTVLIPVEYLGPGDIIEELMSLGDFTTLLTALELAGLDETLKGEGPFTLMAPSDHAFSILPEGALDDLIADVDELTNVLLYHVMGDLYDVDDLVAAGNIETLLGEELLFTLNAHGRPMVNHHVIILADILCSNGIIHMIHMVLLPP